MTEKYLLENDEAGETLSELRMYLSGSNFDGKTYTLKMGELTNVFRQTRLIAYDLPELTQQFPNSFMSGNTLFINAKFLTPTNENKLTDAKEVFKETITVISNGLLDIKNTILNIPTNQDNKIRIISDILSINNLNESLLISTPSIEIKKVDNILINAGLPLERAELSKKINTDTAKLKEVLLANDASYKNMPTI